MASRLPFLPRFASGDLPLIRRLVAENARDFVGRYILAFAAMGVFAATTGASAWLMRDVVDGIFFQRDAALLYFVPLAMALLFALRGVSNYVSLVTLSRIGNAIVARLQRRVFDKVLALDVDFFGRIHSADLVTRMLHHTTAAREAIDRIANTMVRDLLTLVVLVVVMIWQSPWMALIAFTIGPIAIVLVGRLIQRTRQAADVEFRFVSRISSVLQESALGIRIVRAFNLEGVMRRRMEAAIDEVEDRANKVAIMSARTAPIMEGLAGIAVAGILLWTGQAVLGGGASPGSFIAFITALLLAYEPASRLARFNVQLTAKLVGVRLLYELLDTPVSPPAAATAPVPSGRGRIAFEGVSFAYRSGAPVLRDLDFVAEAGATTAIVGQSGAGKSTLIALVERFHDPQAGRITIDGADIASLDVRELRKRIAYVGQDVRLFTGTVRDNIRYGRLDATDAEVEAAARDAMAETFIRALPQGYDTELGPEGGQLSGGQRQRIAIARALVRSASIVLLDEATSALDSESESRVQEAFARLRAGRTTIVVAHRLSTIQGADRICVLGEGRIVEQGTHRALVAAGGAYARLYRMQFASETGANDRDFGRTAMGGAGGL
ncbi:MAG: ABC transporter ATP-binding protein [Bauldia sp.]